MAYLIPNDYLSQIQQTSLLQAISNNPAYQLIIEQVAQTAFVEALTAKYDLSQEFTDTLLYNPAAAYNAGVRIYLDAPLYSASQASYALGVLTLYSGQVYQCINAIAAPQVFTPANWQLLGNQYDIFYAITPYPVFNISKGWYNVGDIVFWKNHTYTALQQSVIFSHAQSLQYYQTYSIPYQNVFPDDPVNGPKWWKDNGAYVVPAGNLLTQNPSTYHLITQARDNISLFAGFSSGMVVGNSSYQDSTYAGWDFWIEQIGFGTLTAGVHFNYIINASGQNIGFTLIGWTFLLNQNYIIHFQPIVSQTAPLNPYSSLTSQQTIATYFIKGDNRNQSVKTHYISLVLNELYGRIPPKAIPETIANKAKAAQIWIEKASMGKDFTPGLIAIQPPQGGRIRAGSLVKQQNSY